MTIAQQLKIKDFPFEIKDTNGNVIYWENSDGSWTKREYDDNGNRIYYENSKGYWVKYEYDANGKEIYSEDSDGYWTKQEYDPSDNLIYHEDSYRVIEDNRPKTEIQKAIELLTKAGLLVDGKILKT